MIVLTDFTRTEVLMLRYPASYYSDCIAKFQTDLNLSSFALIHDVIQTLQSFLYARIIWNGMWPIV